MELQQFLNGTGGSLVIDKHVYAYIVSTLLINMPMKIKGDEGCSLSQQGLEQLGKL